MNNLFKTADDVIKMLKNKDKFEGFELSDDNGDSDNITEVFDSRTFKPLEKGANAFKALLNSIKSK